MQRNNLNYWTSFNINSNFWISQYNQNFGVTVPILLQLEQLPDFHIKGMLKPLKKKKKRKKKN